MRIAVALGAMLVLMLGGCGGEPDADEAAESLSASREQVETRLQETAAVLSDAGFELVEATGEWRMCRMEPKSAMEYSAGGVVSGGEGVPLNRVVTASKALEADGWELESSDRYPRPFANFADGDLRLMLSQSKFSDDLSLILTGGCLDSTTEQENELQGKRFDLL